MASRKIDNLILWVRNNKIVLNKVTGYAIWTPRPRGLNTKQSIGARFFWKEFTPCLRYHNPELKASFSYFDDEKQVPHINCTLSDGSETQLVVSNLNSHDIYRKFLSLDGQYKSTSSGTNWLDEKLQHKKLQTPTDSSE